MKKFLRCKDLIEYQSNHPYDEVCDALVLDLIKNSIDERSLCKVVQATFSKEAWKTVEVKFGMKESDKKQQILLKSIDE